MEISGLNQRRVVTGALVISVLATSVGHAADQAERQTALCPPSNSLLVLAILPVEPFTGEMGVLAAKIDANMKKAGLVLATADLLIGVTALHYGYAVGTRNLRHFQMIPGLRVIAL